MTKDKAKKPERMNAGQTAVLLALGVVSPFQGLTRNEVDSIAENPFVVPSLLNLGLIYPHGKCIILTASGWGWLLGVITEIENRFREQGEGSKDGTETGDTE